jgi:hypothetical protein
MTYDCISPPNTSLTPCYPERQQVVCPMCMRWRHTKADPDRKFVIIDASLFLQNGVCPMYEARASAMPDEV